MAGSGGVRAGLGTGNHESRGERGCGKVDDPNAERQPVGPVQGGGAVKKHAGDEAGGEQGQVEKHKPITEPCPPRDEQHGRGGDQFGGEQEQEPAKTSCPSGSAAIESRSRRRKELRKKE